MVDSILKLKVDSQEYDNKIKRAAEGIKRYADECKQVGGTLEHLDEGVLEFVQALGKMDTVGQTTKQQLREMTNALTDLTATYRGLTDEEKNSPFGQALAQSIDQLTERAGNAKDAMADVAASITNAASDTRLFDQMAQGMSVATAGFQGLTGAGKLLGIEMGNDVQVIAKLQAAMAVTNSLTTIQNALQKQSALMQGLNAAKTALATAAQQAYAVATGEATAAQVAFNIAASANPYMLLLTAAGALVGVVAAFASTTGEATDALEDQKRVIDDITRSVDAAAESYRQLAEHIKSLGIGGKKEYDALMNANKERFDQVNDKWRYVTTRKSEVEAKKGTDNDEWKALDEKQKQLHDELVKIKKEREDLQRDNKERVRRLNQYARLDFSDVTTQSEAQSALSFLKEQQKYKDPTSRDYGNIKRAIEYVENILLPQFQDKTATNVNQKTTTTTKALKEEKDEFVEINGLIAQAEERVSDLQRRIHEAPDETTISTLKGQLVEAQNELERLNNIGTEVNTATLPPLMQMEAVLKQLNEDLKNAETPEAYQNMLADIKAINEEIKAFKGETDKGKGNDRNKRSGKDDLSKLMSGTSSIMSGIQQMGMKLPQGLQDTVSVIQGLISVIQGVQTVISVFSTTAMTANTAAIIANTAAMNVNTAFSLFPLAGGGIVPKAAGGRFIGGNSFSGDNVFAGNAWVNSGELVLNRAEQGNLAAQLTGDGAGGYIPSHISGEQIWVVLNRHTKRKGMGEIVTWK